MSVPMRAKMYIDKIEPYPTEGEPTQEFLHFHAVAKSGPYDENGSDENNTYALYTPMAQLGMTVQNPALLGKYKVGDYFYVDFTPIEK